MSFLRNLGVKGVGVLFLTCFFMAKSRRGNGNPMKSSDLDKKTVEKARGGGTSLR